MAADKNTLKNWFKTGLKPTQAQFWAWLDAFWHKDEVIPQSSIQGLESTLNAKAETSQLEGHKTDPNAHDEKFALKEDKSMKGQVSGYAPLDEFAKVASIYLDIVNDLVSGGEDSLLSAEQGAVLMQHIDAINAILNSDDVNLDTVQELVDALKDIQTYLDTIIVNDLTTGGAAKALSAAMGKLLNERIDGVQSNLNNLADVTVSRLGTTPTKPITGDFEFDNTEGHIKIKAKSGGSYIEFRDDGSFRIVSPIEGVTIKDFFFENGVILSASDASLVSPTEDKIFAQRAYVKLMAVLKHEGPTYNTTGIQTLTQAEYDALTPPQEGVIYHII